MAKRAIISACCILGMGTVPSVVSFLGPSKVCTSRNHPSKTAPGDIIDAEVISPDESSDDVPMSLVEYSQKQDTDWEDTPIAFVDSESNTFIDCTLAFYVKDPQSDKGAEYALGVPCEIPIVVALEGEASGINSDDSDDVLGLSKAVPLSPGGEVDGSVLSLDEKEEVFQLAARALMDEYGESIRLKNTPGVLTVEGSLDEILGDWKSVLLDKMGGGGKEFSEFSVDDVLDALEDDDEDDIFDKVMSRDLGENYMDLAEDDDLLDDEILKLFSGGPDDDDDDLWNQIKNKDDEIPDDSYEQMIQKLSPSSTLKLISFIGPCGNDERAKYLILRPLRPILLVGREDPDDYSRRILLDKEERETILPRLVESCQQGLEEAGFDLTGGVRRGP
mmetsp:Transcript_20402/g.47921  ORF Transcript_20402/g.47921 Transcript_20402/m.47921 type:complete len:390 (+) Transcript_20402:73-1242(+)